MYIRTVSALAALALTAGTLALSTPVHAAPAEEQEQVKVKTGDLDLTSASGVARLDRRVRAAARQICGTVPATDLNMQRQVAGCQQAVLDNAREDVALALRAAGTPYRLALRIR